MKLPLLLLSCASWATGYAAVAFLFGFDTDFQIAALVAIVCLAWGLLAARAQHRHALRAAAWADTWERRLREDERTR